MEEKEVDLRDYIKVILKRKRIIFIIFFVAVITAAMVSFIMPRVYQSTASIMITPSRVLAPLSAQISLGVERAMTTGEYITPAPTISIPTHEVLLKATPVLERIIYKLGLTDELGKPLTVDSLSGRLDVKEVTGTNILQLKVEDNDSKIAREVANAWAQEYIQYSQELILGAVRGTGDFITEQFEIARKSLIQAEERIKEFKNKYKLDLMRAELNIKKAKLKREKEELLNLVIILKAKEDSLRELKRGIEGEEKFIIVSKAITDDALWQRMGEGKGLGDLAEKRLRSEVINPLYQDLRHRIVNTQIELNTLRIRLEHLEKSVESTAKEIDELRKTVHQKEFELLQLTRQAEIYKRTYGDLSNRVEEARIAKAVELGEVKIVSPAIEPEDPIRPEKIRIVATSGALGLMLGTFLAFFMEFWQSSKKETEK